MATALSPDLPFTVTEYVNPRTKSISYRVQGSPGGKRFRQNCKTAAAAAALRDFKNAEALHLQADRSPPRLVQTRLPDADVLALEAGMQRAAGRWSAIEIIDAGLGALAAAPADVPLEPKFRAWLKRMEGDLGKTWLREIEARGDYFFKAHPGITALQLTPNYFARWIAALKCKGQTKANYRNALSRWGSDMQSEGVFTVNPFKGLRIAKRKDKHGIPSILTPKQAKAFLFVHLHSPDLRPELGWVVECLLVGLRPENEAPHAVWSEIDLARGEQNVLGYKRGVKPRLVQLQPVAVEWLKLVKKDKRPQIAPYTRHLRRAAVIRANAWLARHARGEDPIEWDGDILRHTYASMRAAAGVKMPDLADEMGTSTSMIYGHYRNVRPKRDAEEFWALTPALIRGLSA